MLTSVDKCLKVTKKRHKEYEDLSNCIDECSFLHSQRKCMVPVTNCKFDAEIKHDFLAFREKTYLVKCQCMPLCPFRCFSLK